MRNPSEASALAQQDQPRFLTAFRRSGHCRALLVFALLLGACTTQKSEFIAGRSLDRCNQSWPACGDIVGCLIGPESYIEGHFPGSGGFIVELAEPSTVEVHLFLSDINAAGTSTLFIWNEGGCTGRVREDVTGLDLTDEINRTGEFVRAADLTTVGDHLIQFSSDAQAEYTLKVEVLPKRLNP